MSLYIGKKSDGVTPLVHLTTNTHTVAEINNAPISDTVFHSDIDVFQISETITYTLSTPTIYGSERYVADQSLAGFNGSIGLMICRFTNGDILSSFGIINNSSLILWRNDGPSTSNQFLATSYGNAAPTTDYYIANRFGIYNNTIASIKCYILDSNVDNNGVVSLASMHKTNNEILISKSQFIIGGVDIFSLPILCAVPDKTTTTVWFPFPNKATTGNNEPFINYVAGDDVSTAFYDASTDVVHSGVLYGTLDKNTTDLQLYADHISQSFNDSTGTTIVSSTMTINSLVKQVAANTYVNATNQVYTLTTIYSTHISSWYTSLTDKVIIGLHVAYNGVAGSPGVAYTANYSSLAILNNIPLNVDYPFLTFLNFDGALNIYESFTLYANISSGGTLYIKFKSGDTISDVVINTTVNQFI